MTEEEVTFLREVVIPKMRNAAPQEQGMKNNETVPEYIARGGVVHAYGNTNGSNTACGGFIGAVSKKISQQNCVRCAKTKRNQKLRYLRIPPAA